MPACGADWARTALSRDEFVDKVCDQGRRLYRDLPWRCVDDPYAVMVSEVMLQQTQVSRVAKYWERFLSSFPTVDALAAASTSDVLEHWQGLGYNRRALALKRAADLVSAEMGGVLPRTAEGLVALPGVGPATAAGVMAFAYRLPSVYIETNVRTVFLHELFPDREKVSDRVLEPYVRQTCPESPARAEGAASPCRADARARGAAPFAPLGDPSEDARAWYYALLDYGAHLKTQVANPSRRSSHYARQSAFEGSHRQKRSFILKLALASPEGVSEAEALAALSRFEVESGRDAIDAQRGRTIVDELVGEGFFKRQGELLVP
ncbi:MAG: adenine glycosylase [Berryella intestinalis]|uniref:adenine glycosylase n=1 Tax=Berryella intestinalis TaxID=1531429 RepID=UPI002A51952A|nr:adenine glycosylase [Berryella intestinalis]MDD7369852.1 adenine glycosylase [Berryella intestinalis]MDY3129593.1 adenine glycosylase [Berryella intestinalis]